MNGMNQLYSFVKANAKTQCNNNRPLSLFAIRFPLPSTSERLPASQSFCSNSHPMELQPPHFPFVFFTYRVAKPAYSDPLFISILAIFNFLHLFSLPPAHPPHVPLEKFFFLCHLSVTLCHTKIKYQIKLPLTSHCTHPPTPTPSLKYTLNWFSKRNEFFENVCK